MSLPDHSRLIAWRTCAVAQEFAKYLQGVHSEAELADLEMSIDDLMSAFQQVWDTVAPGGAWTSGARDEYEPVVRTLATGVTLFQVLAQVACRHAGHPWGTHLFSPAQLRMVPFDQLPSELPDAGLTRMIPDLAADLVIAVDTLTDVTPASGLGIKKDLVAALFEVCEACGCTMQDATRIGEDWGLGALLTPAEAAAQLGTDEPDVLSRVARREVVAVPLWTGAWRLPAFQFSRDRVHPHVENVLRHAHDRLRGWPLALWMAVAVRDRRPEAWYQQVLGARGLWKPHWSDPETGEFDDVDVSRPATPVDGVLHRISRSDFGPFYFSHVTPTAGGGVTPPAGRFDLEAGMTDLGTMYTATTAKGACNEVLDREPVLTLSEVLDRTMWRLEPRSTIDVIDLTDLSASLAATTNRRDTQSLALRMSRGSKGLRVGLRTSSAEVGVAVFGRAGGHLPSSVGLGVWSAEGQPLLATDALWAYVEARDRDQGGFPVLFRQFPDVGIVRTTVP